MHLELDGLTIEFSKKSIKNINLRIYPTGRVTLSAPRTCSMDKIQRYLQEKKDWIREQRARLQAVPIKPELQMQTGEFCKFLGESYPLIVHEGNFPKGVRLIDKNLECFVHVGASFEEKNKILQNWYRQQLHALLPDLIKKWEPVVGANALSYHIKAMKTRWGTCNPTKKRIWLNLHLIQKPLICIEYVLVHELVHLHEPSHNRRFHAFMHQFMPDWMAHKKLLRD